MSSSQTQGDKLPEVEAGIRAVRIGHGANCSSMGSVIDTLFATATVGAAIFVAVAAALKAEPVRVAGKHAKAPEQDEGPKRESAP